MSPLSIPPKSIKELNIIAKVHTDECIPIDIYISSANLLLKQARIYFREENEEQAYIYYLKYINLVLNELGQRPGFNQLDQNMVKTCMEALDSIESLKSSIEAVHESYELFHSKAQLSPNTETSSHKIQPSQNDDQRTSYFFEPTPMDWEHTPIPQVLKYLPLPQQHYADTHRLHKKQEQKLPPPPLPPKIKLNKDIPPPLPPKIQLFLNQENDFSLDDNSFFGSRLNKLRILNIPKCIQESFLNIARHNTSKNVETCGILSGKLRNNELFVTSLLIPNQEGTSDTCITKDEEAIFDYQDKNGLLTLGWIHTHPSQTCFLSSVDLHTHCSYQLMLPEAIAIVCAPNHIPDFGIFRLISPDGLKEITNCRIRESFHPHSDKSILYQDDSKHIRLDTLGILDIVDLR